MPVEIRELTIKTSIVSRPAPAPDALHGAALAALKEQIVQQCLAQMKHAVNKNNFDR